MADLYSPYSSTATSTPVNTSWWLKDYLDWNRDLAVAVVPDWGPTRRVMAGEFFPRGRTEAVVATGEIYGISAPVTIRVQNETDYNKLITLLTSKRVLLLQSVLPQQWWVKVSDDIRERLVRASTRGGEITPIAFVFELATRLTQVKAPAA